MKPWADPDGLEVTLASVEVAGPVAGIFLLLGFMGIAARVLRFAGREV